MTNTEKIQLIDDVVAAYKNQSEAFDKLRHAVGAAPDSLLFDSVWRAFDKYVDAVSKLIGDDFKYLPWFIFDNECGDNAYEVRWTDRDKRGRKRKVTVSVKTTRNLLRVIQSSQQK